MMNLACRMLLVVAVRFIYECQAGFWTPAPTPAPNTTTTSQANSSSEDPTPAANTTTTTLVTTRKPSQANSSSEAPTPAPNTTTTTQPSQANSSSEAPPQTSTTRSLRSTSRANSSSEAPTPAPNTTTTLAPTPAATPATTLATTRKPSQANSSSEAPTTAPIPAGDCSKADADKLVWGESTESTCLSSFKSGSTCEANCTSSTVQALGKFSCFDGHVKGSSFCKSATSNKKATVETVVSSTATMQFSKKPSVANMKTAIAAGCGTTVNMIYKLKITAAARRLWEAVSQFQEGARRLESHLSSYDVEYSIIVSSIGDQSANQVALENKMKELTTANSAAQMAMTSSLNSTETDLTFGTIVMKKVPVAVHDVVVVRNADNSIVAPPDPTSTTNTTAVTTAAPVYGSTSGTQMLAPSFAAFAVGLLMWMMMIA